MKRNNVAKKLGIASLCLATVISAFSGITSVANNVALADGTTVAYKDFLDTETLSLDDDITREAFTSVNADNKDKSTTYNSFTVRSDTAYEATFKTVFTGDATFNYGFAEKDSAATDYSYGDFKFRITDVTDENNYFELVHFVRRQTSSASTNWTGFYLAYNDQYRTATTSTSAAVSNWKNVYKTSTNTDKQQYLPNFLNRGSYSTRRNSLQLTWTDEGVLQIHTYAGSVQKAASNGNILLAQFDGTDTFEAGTSHTSCGLPKLSFPNGYKVTISSSFTHTKTTDQATDVYFTSIVNNEVTYNFNTQETLKKDSYMEAYDALFGTPTEPEAQPGEVSQVLLGYQDAQGNLYPTESEGYTAVYLGFDTINGASVRIDTSVGGQSGIRFMTTFNVNDYASVKGYIQSCGTLIAYTNALTKDDFTIENYATEIAAGTQVAQVPNTKGVFTYIDQNNKSYTAYSMALVGITENTQEYSARGYIVVKYADGTTATVYTDYDADLNTRSIAEVAYKLQQSAEYQTYTAEQKAIVDGYADDYVVAE